MVASWRKFLRFQFSGDHVAMVGKRDESMCGLVLSVLLMSLGATFCATNLAEKLNSHLTN